MEDTTENPMSAGVVETQQQPTEESTTTSTTMMTCRITRDELQQILEKSEYGEKSTIFNCYFEPSVVPPKCLVCHRLIGQHANAAESQPTAAVATAAPASPSDPTKLVLSRPDGLVQDPADPDIERVSELYSRPAAFICISLALLCTVATLVQTILIIHLATTSEDGDSWFAVFMMGTVGLPLSFMGMFIILFVFKDKDCVIIFNKRTRMCRSEEKYLLWFCGCGSDDTYHFDELLHVEQETEGLVQRLICRIRGGMNGEKLILSNQVADGQRIAWTKFIDTLRPPPAEAFAGEEIPPATVVPFSPDPAVSEQQ